MTQQDRLQLVRWIASGATLHEVENAPPVGMVGNIRFTETARRAFRLAHEWSAPRFSSTAQSRYFTKCGAAALDRRINRARHLVARFMEENA